MLKDLPLLCNQWRNQNVTKKCGIRFLLGFVYLLICCYDVICYDKQIRVDLVCFLLSLFLQKSEDLAYLFSSRLLKILPTCKDNSHHAIFREPSIRFKSKLDFCRRSFPTIQKCGNFFFFFLKLSLIICSQLVIYDKKGVHSSSIWSLELFSQSPLSRTKRELDGQSW